MTASGTFGYGEDLSTYMEPNCIGALVTKGLSVEPRLGNPPPRIMETPSGLLNSVGLQNIGVRNFIQEHLPKLRAYNVPVIANIYGETIDDYCKVAEILSSEKGVHALEVNISCPNVKCGGIAFGATADSASEVAQQVKQASRLPVIVKLTPNVSDIAEIACAVEKAGADAVSLINTIMGMSVDIETRRPHLKSITGGLSGPAIRPIALRMVYEVFRRVHIPVIGIGGIMNASDAIAFLIVGASAVQIGTANFIDPAVAPKIIVGIESYLANHGIGNIQELIGSLRID
jgi:dihydroorotate dehydrogenase (NAD+) catalytic subunit